ncbi:(2Fe-2S)-binding protein [Steroidobacter sp. S1-65]|uniref:(2Fe-2S)-binding protein n=1 Tax=Steroidobacter gossypii TaxID=2805490 RepID=A0ABS1WTI1_9GAMM|nr:(2Fe-2S)-binding protein [Steroidobacter gossypii]MBM0104271.1 (2Fe-2S)-binding protein [Steroidobacter gossypii]
MTDSLSRREFLGASGAAVGVALTPAGATAAPKGRTAERMVDVTCNVNGRPVSAHVEARTTLLDHLRERMDLTGTKKGCNEGACGACTVLVDGKRMNACLILLAQCEGRAITTVEGIAQPDGSLHPVQQAFIDHDAFQCGFCTPGQVVSAAACIAEGHATSEASVREWMSGNLCRCSAYPQITAAVLAAARRA